MTLEKLLDQVLKTCILQEYTESLGLAPTQKILLMNLIVLQVQIRIVKLNIFCGRNLSFANHNVSEHFAPDVFQKFYWINILLYHCLFRTQRNREFQYHHSYKLVRSRVDSWNTLLSNSKWSFLLFSRWYLRCQDYVDE